MSKENSLPMESEIAELLKKDSEEANPSEEVSEETELDENGDPIEDDPELDADGNPIEDEEEDLEPEEDLKPKSKVRVQARIDELVASNKATLAALQEEREARKALEDRISEKPKVTLEQLRAIMADPAQSEYHQWAMETLIDIKADEKLAKISGSNQSQMAAQSSLSKAIEQYPELAESKGKDIHGNPIHSDLWVRANQIFLQKNLAGVEDGQYIAAVMAASELDGNIVKTAKATRKSLDKENARKQLSGNVRKVTTSVSGTKDKLFAEARRTGDFRQFLKYSAEHGG